MGDVIPIDAAPSLRDLDPETQHRDAPVIVDQRGRNNPTAHARKAERERLAEVKRQQKAAQETWAKQAAGTMWWSAQNPALPERQREKLLEKREELLVGARKQGLAV